MTMPWRLSRQWAPSLLVAVQSHPRYLIEIWLYCIVAVVLGVAVLIRNRPSRPLELFFFLDDTINDPGPESLSSLLEGQEAEEAQEAALDDADRLSAGDAGAGDAVGADLRHWVREALAAPAAAAAASLQVDSTVHPVQVHAACAACHAALTSTDVVPMTSSDALLAEEDEDVVVEDLDEDVDGDVLDDGEFVLSVGDSTLTLGGDQSSEAVQHVQHESEVQDEPAGAPPPRGNMVEYVSARYQSFKKAALAEKLLAVDPGALTSTLLSSEKDLLAILSLALKPRRAGASWRGRQQGN
ncbi:uncharacterized protein LOC117649528 [Thrips palmi]|uniref:Uncharacterized protein LOC117649528 n=1 Tax=Thrips palmi TaxID=161013 RepID=A0A6P8ZSQ3_THRPL|nr:uncharacterized protein LOC117649528 [Thrips palmi]